MDDRRARTENARPDRRTPRRRSGPDPRGSARRGRRRPATRDQEQGRTEQNRSRGCGARPTEPNTEHGTEPTEPTHAEPNGTDSRGTRNGTGRRDYHGVAAGRLAFDGGTWAARKAPPARNRARTDTNCEGDVPDSEPHEEGPEGQRPRNGRTGRDSRQRAQPGRQRSTSICTSRLDRRSGTAARTGQQTRRGARGAGPASKPRTLRKSSNTNQTGLEKPNRTERARRDPSMDGPAQGHGSRGQRPRRGRDEPKVTNEDGPAGGREDV